MARINKNDENIEAFAGWETDEEKLRHNLTWSKEQILNWLEEANKISREAKKKKHVLSEHNTKTE